MGKKLIFESARDAVLYGLLQATRLAEITYGPYGRTIGLQKGNDLRITKDGITVLNDVSFDDPRMEMGAVIVKESSGRANHISGDGSTSTAILTGSLSKSANDILKSGVDINELRKGYNKALEDTLTQLEKFKIDPDTEDPEKFIHNVAMVSANNDSEIADNVTKAFLSIGDGGVVQYSQSTSPTGKTEVVVNDGAQFRGTGYITSACCNNATQDRAVYKDVEVIVFGDTIKSVDELQAVLMPLLKQKKYFAIFAPLYAEEPSAFLATKFGASQKNGGMGVACLIPGTQRETIVENMLDIAAVTGATIIGREKPIEEFDPAKDYGHCDEIIVNERDLTFMGPKHSADFDKWVSELCALRDSDDAANGISQSERDQLRIRIGRMTGGVATIYIGALTAVETSEKRDRYEDALNAVKTALASGVLVGGSSALFKISGKLQPPKDFTVGERAAYNAFIKAIRRPCTRLIESSGVLLEDVASDIKKSDIKTGFNARTRKVENLVDLGIVDPYRVIYNSLRYAMSGAMQFASIDGLSINSNANLQCIPIDRLIDGDREVIED